jgi:drug/metabolite transporter (DMT)-like permease
MLLLQFSIFYGKASLSAVIVSMNPLFVSVFALLLINEKLPRTQLISLVLGIIGLVVIIFSETELFQTSYRQLPWGFSLQYWRLSVLGYTRC